MIERQQNGGVPMTSFTVMSYNIRGGIGSDNRYELNRIADAIRGSGAGIVGLQEVDVLWNDRSRREDQVRLLAEELGMEAFFAPIYELPPHVEGQPARQFGVALLSRFPLRAGYNHPMTRLSSQHPGQGPMPMPGFAEVQLDIQGTLLSVYVAHLDYRPDPAVRHQQIRELLAIVEQSPHEKLLLGDFNTVPASAELSPLFARFREAWRETHPGTEPGHTFPADVPDRKIDYIMLSGGLRAVSSHIPETLASDHRPLIADIQI